MIILTAVSAMLAIYFIWLGFNSFYAFIKYFKVDQSNIRFTIKKGETPLSESFIKKISNYYLAAIILLGIAWTFFLGTLMGILGISGLYVFVLGWLIHDGFKYFCTLKIGTFVSDIGVHHGAELYPWKTIKHHRWILKKRPKKETDQLHLFLRKKGRINPLTFEVYYHDREAIQEILDQHIQNTERDA